MASCPRYGTVRYSLWSGELRWPMLILILHDAPGLAILPMPRSHGWAWTRGRGACRRSPPAAKQVRAGDAMAGRVVCELSTSMPRPASGHP